MTCISILFGPRTAAAALIVLMGVVIGVSCTLLMWKVRLGWQWDWLMGLAATRGDWLMGLAATRREWSVFEKFYS